MNDLSDDEKTMRNAFNALEKNATEQALPLLLDAIRVGSDSVKKECCKVIRYNYAEKGAINNLQLTAVIEVLEDVIEGKSLKNPFSDDGIFSRYFAIQALKTMSHSIQIPILVGCIRKGPNTVSQLGFQILYTYAMGGKILLPDVQRATTIFEDVLQGKEIIDAESEDLINNRKLAAESLSFLYCSHSLSDLLKFINKGPDFATALGCKYLKIAVENGVGLSGLDHAIVKSMESVLLDQALIGESTSDSTKARTDAALILGYIESEHALDLLNVVVNQCSEGVDVACCLAIKSLALRTSKSEFREKAIAQLRDIMRGNTNAGVNARIAATESLVELQSVDSLPAFLDALKNGPLQIQQTICSGIYALLKCSTTNAYSHQIILAMEGLVKEGSSDSFARVKAVKILGELRSVESIPLLVEYCVGLVPLSLACCESLVLINEDHSISDGILKKCTDLLIGFIAGRKVEYKYRAFCALGELIGKINPSMLSDVLDDFGCGREAYGWPGNDLLLEEPIRYDYEDEFGKPIPNSRNTLRPTREMLKCKIDIRDWRTLNAAYMLGWQESENISELLWLMNELIVTDATIWSCCTAFNNMEDCDVEDYEEDIATTMVKVISGEILKKPDSGMGCAAKAEAATLLGKCVGAGLDFDILFRAVDHGPDIVRLAACQAIRKIASIHGGGNFITGGSELPALRLLSQRLLDKPSTSVGIKVREQAAYVLASLCEMNQLANAIKFGPADVCWDCCFAVDEYFENFHTTSGVEFDYDEDMIRIDHLEIVNAMECVLENSTVSKPEESERIVLRIKVIENLGHLKSYASIPVLLKTLVEDSKDIQRTSVNAILEILGFLDGNPSLFDQEYILHSIESILIYKGFDCLEYEFEFPIWKGNFKYSQFDRVESDVEFELKIRAIRILNRLDVESDVVPILLKAIDSSKNEIREECYEVLNSLMDRVKSIPNKKLEANALQQIFSNSAIIDSENLDAIEIRVKAIENYKTDYQGAGAAVPALLANLDRGPDRVRSASCIALYQHALGDSINDNQKDLVFKKLTSILIEDSLDDLYSDEGVKARSHSANAIRLIDAGEAVLPLLKSLEIGPDKVRRSACHAIYFISSKVHENHIAQVIEALNDILTGECLDEPDSEAGVNARINSANAIEEFLNSHSISNSEIIKGLIDALSSHTLVANFKYLQDKLSAELKHIK